MSCCRRVLTMSLSSPSPATPPPAADHPRLVADIGGTNARFAWIAEPGVAPSHVQTLRVADHAGPAEAASAYLAALAQRLGAAWRAPRRAAFAVATAVVGDRVAFTNSAWDFSREGVRQALALQSLCVVNDFEALALSLPQLSASQCRAHPQPQLQYRNQPRHPAVMMPQSPVVMFRLLVVLLQLQHP